MGQIKRLAGETALYGLGSILPRFLNFLLVSLHTGVFAAAEYGVITKLFAYVAVVNIIYLFGMETAYFRYANKPAADEKSVFNLAQTVVVGISVFATTLLIIFADGVADLIGIHGHADLVIMLAIIMFIDGIVAIPFSRLRLQRKPLKFVIGKLTNIILLVGLNVYLLYFLESPAKISYIILANLVANAFYIFLFFRTLITWRPAYDSTITPQMLSYSYPIMLTGLAGMTNEMFSRITLEKWLPDSFYTGISKAAALGIFGACYKLSVLMNLAIQAFRFAAEPFFFSQSNEKNSPQLFAKVNHYFVIVCCFLLLGVSINLDILKHFLRGEEYWLGLEIVPVLLLAYLFLGVYYNMSVWFKLTDKTYVGTLITIFGVFITIAGNYYLIPVWGYMGSSVAALLCYFLMTVVCYVLGQKYFPIPYHLGGDLTYIVGTSVLVYLINFFTSSHFVDDLIAATFLRFIIMLLYIALVVVIERKNFRTT